MNIEMPASRPSNQLSIYERQRALECADLTPFYEGGLNALFCIISSERATEAERAALLATAKRGNFEPTEMIWIAMNATGSSQLEAPDLMRLIESVDPLCLIVLDQRAAEVLSRAYNQPVKLEACDSILGRPCAAFVHFDRMLQTDARKQQAWMLLKETITRTNDL